jgi:tRNA A37 threonylcarbamoyladenosine synthetase subunit TsaC/SUA5/YrdC
MSLIPVTHQHRKLIKQNLQKALLTLYYDKGPLLTDLSYSTDSFSAAFLAAEGCPIAFSGLGVIGLGGSYKAFLQDYQTFSKAKIAHIGRLKGRDFVKQPPIVLCSWKKLSSLVDWAKIKGSYDEQEVKALIKNIYDYLPVHLVLPIKTNTKERKPNYISTFDSLSKKFFCRAFMMCTHYQPLQNFIRMFESITQEVFYASSANLHGLRTITDPREVRKTFPTIPVILIDFNFFPNRVKNWPSHTIYDFSQFPEKIGVVRLGSVAHELLTEILSASHFKPQIEFSGSREEITLTQDPPFNSLSAIKKILNLN